MVGADNEWRITTWPEQMKRGCGELDFGMPLDTFLKRMIEVTRRKKNSGDQKWRLRRRELVADPQGYNSF